MKVPNIVVKDDEPKRIWDLSVPIIHNKEDKTTSVYLTGGIEEPSEYNELCYMLKEANIDEEIHMYINTPGGIVDSAFMIAGAIRTSKAKIVAHLSGTVASAGTLISMACDELETEKHISFTIHNYSGSMGGKGNEMKARQNFVDKSITAAFNDFYAGFLTEEEIAEIVEGKDIWMDTEEVNKRWESKVSYIEGELNE